MTRRLSAVIAAAAFALGLAHMPTSADATAPARRCAQAPGQGLGLTNIAAHGRELLAVGADGLVASSSDGARWRLDPTRVQHALRGVAWNGRRWIVVGDVGTIMSSGNGRTWRVAGGVPPVGLRGIAARPALAVAGGSAGTIVSSTDTTVWARQASGTQAILWGGAPLGSTLALSGQYSTVIATSNGITWRAVPTFPRPTDNQVAPRPFLWQLARGPHRLVAVGDFGAILEGSLSGLHAVRSPTDEILRGVTFGRRLAVAVGSSGVILESRSPGKWVRVPSPTTVDLRGVAFTGSQFVAVGDESTVISSRDGRHWHIDQTAMPCALLSVARGAGRFVAVGGSGHILASRRGTNWRSVRSPTRQDLYDVAYGGSGFVAVGARGTVLQSSAGGRWRIRHIGTSLNLHAVAWTGREYVIGGDRGLLFGSRTGARWRRIPFAAFHSLRGFATSGGVTVVAGAGTVGRYSPAGGWQFESTGLGRFQTAVAAGNGRFVIVGHNGEALVSTDGGRSWTAGNTGIDVNLDRVSYDGKRFIATGEGTEIVSTDGLNWSPLTLPTKFSIRSISVSRGAAIAVGDGGVILRSVDGGLRWRRIRRGS